jgi:hypothetical protein
LAGYGTAIPGYWCVNRDSARSEGNALFALGLWIVRFLHGARRSGPDVAPATATIDTGISPVSAYRRCGMASVDIDICHRAWEPIRAVFCFRAGSGSLSLGPVGNADNCDRFGRVAMDRCPGLQCRIFLAP